MAHGMTKRVIVNNASGIGGALDLQLLQSGPTLVTSIALGTQSGTPIYFKVWDAPGPGDVFNPVTMHFTRQPDQMFVIPGNAAGAGSNVQPGAPPIIGGIPFDNGLVIGWSTAFVTAGASGIADQSAYASLVYK